MTERPRGFPQPKAAADLVKNIIQQKVDEAKQAKVDAERARKRSKNRVPLMLGLLPVLIGLTAWNVVSNAGPPRSTLSTGERLSSLKFQIYIAAEAIEGYRTAHGTFPRNLTEVGADWQGLHYVPAETTWSIVGRVDSVAVTYQHGESLVPFAAAYQLLQRKKQ
jgi:hypothetical protein